MEQKSQNDFVANREHKFVFMNPDAESASFRLSSATMRNLEVWDGTISLKDFCVAAKTLVERWKQVNPSLPQWRWIPCKSTLCKEEGYLSLEDMCHLGRNEECLIVESFSEREETDDVATLVRSTSNETHIYDFHIVYSFSYQVPVLYFHGHQSDGQPLNLDEVEKDLPPSSSKVLRESKWTFMTLGEHPYLRRPWFTLHPCATSDWMKLLFGDTSVKDLDISRYLPSWLSVVGQAVGLRIPLELQQRSIEHPSASYVIINN
ncbi:hypothetical protein DsansV1_C09g0095181 [Dioscorea sansibarensis]